MCVIKQRQGFRKNREPNSTPLKGLRRLGSRLLSAGGILGPLRPIF